MNRFIGGMIGKAFNRIFHPQIKLRDEYIDWLSLANPGMMDPGNLYCLDYAVRNLPSDNPILEIGSFCGLSTNVIAYLLRKHGKGNRLIATDRWLFEGAERDGCVGESHIGHAEYREFIKESFLRNVKMFSGKNLPHAVELLSDEFFHAWEEKQEVQNLFGHEASLGGKLSFVFIDGNHSYEFAKRDFTNADKFLEPGGFILLDDSGDFSPWEVNRVAREAAESGKYETILKNPNYLLRKSGK